MFLEIRDHIHDKRWTVDGDNASTERQLRDLFPAVASLANPGNLDALITAIERLPGFTVSGTGYQKPYLPTRGIVPDAENFDPSQDDPWRREGDDPEIMNDFSLDE